MKKVNFSFGSVSPVIEKIEQLSKLQRILIYAGTCLVLVGAFAYFSYLPKFKQIEKLQLEHQKYEKELAKAKKNARDLNKYRSEMKAAEAKFKIMAKALPEKQEIPTLLAGISQSGKDAGLDFLLFQPKPEVQQGFYAEIPVSITVTGQYFQVADFFDRVANLSRIVNIRDIRMAPSGQSTELKSSCTAVTYKFVQEPKDNQKKKKKKRKKK